MAATLTSYAVIDIDPASRRETLPSRLLIRFPSQTNGNTMSAVVEQMTQTFDPDELKALAEESTDCFITMLLPTHRHSPDYKQDHIRLKNLVAKAESLIPENFRSKGLLDEPKRRIDDDHFWQHQLDGLAVFITPESTRYRQLDFNVPERLFVNSHPLIRPLVPRFDRVDHAVVLTITGDSAQLFSYQGGRMEVEEHDAFPVRLEEITSVRDPEDQLQLHSQRQGGGPSQAGASEAAIYHGHGSGERQVEADKRQYLTNVASAFSKATYGNSAKAVVVGTEEVLGHFKSVAKRDDLVEVVGSPAEYKPDELADRVRDAVQKSSSELKEQLKEEFGQAVSSDKGSVNLVKLHQAAKQARIDKLLLLDDQEIWAEADGDQLTILQSDEPAATSDRQPDQNQFELVNALVIETLKQGGSVIRGDSSDFELPDSTVAAAFRF